MSKQATAGEAATEKEIGELFEVATEWGKEAGEFAMRYYGHRVQFEDKQEFLNPIGNVQGGFICAMLDDTLGPALVATLPRLQDRSCVRASCV